ncbi:MAG TPA: cytochrome b N-terminal domain-containing protein [Kofleriaceae bacterium]|nr:cytochrome b N-terminal domain-containing protein [Kofleriaceae bacterium]
MSKITDWLEDRTGYRAVLSTAFDERIPGGASFAYVFGSVLIFMLGLQFVTGVLLALYYSPSASDAWASVAYIQDQAAVGWFIRGLHHHGASAIIICAGLHMLQTAVWGAYKKPREVTWMVGVLMLALLLAFALTGYLLPWDQTGYWATKVATGIAGTSPGVGEQLQQLAQSGNEYGNLTITRFFALHVFVLPALLIGLVTVHIWLFRRHGVTPRWGKSDAALEGKVDLFWPKQVFRDAVAMAIVFAILLAVNFMTHGAGLDAPADPASNFAARPEWYFRPLFQLLKYFHGSLEHVVALGTPVVVAVVLLGLPFADRGSSRSPRARLKYLAVLAAGVVGIGMLTVLSFSEDASNKKYQAQIAESEKQADKARELAATYGVPPAGGMAVFTTEPGYRAQKIFADKCAGCHTGTDRQGPAIGPGYNSRAWIRAFLKNPSGDEFFGPTKIHKMKPVTLEAKDFDAVVEMVYAETGAADADAALVSRGKELFDNDGNCWNCHSIDWETTGDVGPNLGRRGSVDMLTEFIADPAHARWFGDNNAMPAFADKLSEADRRLLAEHILRLQAMPLPTTQN